VPLSFDDLPQDYVDPSELPDSVLQLSGRRVAISGFLSVHGGEGDLFRSYKVRGCVSELPGVEGTIGLTLADHRDLIAHGERARITGVFRVAPTVQDGFCLDLYQMQVEHVELLR
jgi:hypothetical protein